MFKTRLFLIQQPPSAPTSITMAASKVGLTIEKSQAFKNACDVNWCQHICGLPHPRTYGQEYKAWRNAIKCKMEQDRIPGWKQSTAPQWAALRAYTIRLQLVSRRLGLWQANSLRSERFTECLDFLLKDIAKKHQRILTDRLKVQRVATIAVADPTPARNDRKLASSVRIHVPYMLIQLLQVSPTNAPSVPGWISHPKSAQAAHFLWGWTKSRGKPLNRFTGWS